ncbi:17634_t:CDS:2 [Cetraspora pellucida]|uniref:17634_t:CDS:1 n=1 Tax=Cetraspora pellucida TaxID=1433469 RepID=A0A9N8Z1Y8_9GLOM|nr:17634_t:CDS:2 [Cetraspora pellucida]
MKKLLIVLIFLVYIAIYTTALPIIPINQSDSSETGKSSQNDISTDVPDPTIVSERDALEKREPIDFTSFNPASDNAR